MNLGDVLLHRADHAPDAVAYTFAEPAGPAAPDVSLTHAQLAARASALAAQIARCPDGPVLLALPAGPGYVIGVFAAFLAGRPAVPADSPRSPGSRLRGIVADARPAVALTDDPAGVGTGPVVLPIPDVTADDTGWRSVRRVEPADTAVVQYTSGSTSTPRGVRVRHESLTANTAAIAQRFALTPASRSLTWLPPYHDMGLVGGLLSPLATGVPARVLRPADVLRSPLWWLRQVTEHGIDVTGGPNSAYELCVRRARRPDATDGLDLAGWRIAFNGGEPVRAETLRAFADRFADAGFAPEAFVPCYGLAEATLMVSAGHWSPAADGPVSCGSPVPGQHVVVVDPVRGTPVDDGVEGEIRISGPHVTAGYLGGPAATPSARDLFADVDGVPMLRTGDRGHRRDGALYVTGRAKDVIVFRGVNHHAVDVERAGLAAAGAAATTAAAFELDVVTAAGPALVVEVRGRRDPELAARVAAAVLATTGLPLRMVALVPPRSVPRTTSGKVRRSACRDAYLAGHYADAVVHGSPDPDDRPDPGTRPDPGGGLVGLICGVLSGVAAAAEVRPTDGLAVLGVDSVAAAEASAVLQDALDLPVPLKSLLGARTPQDVADALVDGWLAAGHSAQLVAGRIEHVTTPSPEGAL